MTGDYHAVGAGLDQHCTASWNVRSHRATLGISLTQVRARRVAFGGSVDPLGRDPGRFVSVLDGQCRQYPSGGPQTYYIGNVLEAVDHGLTGPCAGYAVGCQVRSERSVRGRTIVVRMRGRSNAVQDAFYEAGDGGRVLRSWSVRVTLRRMR